MTRSWGEGLLGVMSKNEQIQFFDSQIYFPVILIPIISGGSLLEVA